MGAFVVIASFVVAIRIVQFPVSPALGSYDCAIVLGTAVVDNKPSPVFQARIDHALDLHRRGVVRQLIFTGGLGDQKRISEAEAASKYAFSEGIPANAILSETTSRTTWQNLIESRKLMHSHHLDSAVLVSDPYHLPRACAMAGDLGIHATPSATPLTRYRSLSTKLPFLVREVVFTFVYWIYKG